MFHFLSLESCFVKAEVLSPSCYFLIIIVETIKITLNLKSLPNIILLTVICITVLLIFLCKAFTKQVKHSLFLRDLAIHVYSDLEIIVLEISPINYWWILS